MDDSIAKSLGRAVVGAPNGVPPIASPPIPQALQSQPQPTASSIMGPGSPAAQGWATIQNKMHQPVDPMSVLNQGSPAGVAEAMAPLAGKLFEDGESVMGRMLPNGQKQVLKTVPLEDISGDPGNTIYPEIVDKYQREGYAEPAELRLSDPNNPDTPTKYTIQEGHHRIYSDYKNGAKAVRAWVPEEQ